MDLGRQWNTRLKIWNDEFEKHYFEPIEELDMEGFFTFSHLSYNDAIQQEALPIHVNDRWGSKWEYGWFHTRITLGEQYANQRVVFHLGVGEEMLVWVNKKEAGAIDKKHYYITLTTNAIVGTTYDIMAECYAGHGMRPENGGIYPWEVEVIPEPPKQQVTIHKSMVGIFNEDIYQTAMDYKVLYRLLSVLPERSLRAMRIAKGLKEFTYVADFELDKKERTQSILKARKLLTPLLECVNGSTAPEFTIFGQSHLDLAWLWTTEETKRKAARTYSNQLALMKEYKDYQFLLCEPPIIEYLQQFYPNVYQEVLDKESEGRFISEGGLWVECDTNIPSGESLIRQFLYGQLWFERVFHKQTKIAWMPDTFGFSGALPQIMKECNIQYFMTQKLLRCDPECDPFPYNIFWWEGIDGTRILSHIYKKNNAVFDPATLVERWEKDRNQDEDIEGLCFPFGYGDGGGGPTRDMLEMVIRCRNLEGAPRCTMQSPVKYFEQLKTGDITNSYVGELYLSWHRGTYTAQARTKRLMRRAEIAVREAEYWDSLWLLDHMEYKETVLVFYTILWKRLLFQQFHDILPGTSIHKVYEEAEAELEDIIQQANNRSEECLKKLSDSKQQGTFVYNSAACERFYKGRRVPAYSICDCSCACNDESMLSLTFTQKDTGICYDMENDQVKAVVDSKGRVIHLILKSSLRDFIIKPANEFSMFQDINVDYDAWELSAMHEQIPIELGQSVDIIPDTSSKEEIVLHVTRMLHHSLLHQDIILKKHAKRLEFVNTMEWKERHKVLKVSFPVDVFAKEAMEEIQFGYIKRPTHRSRTFDRDRYEVCNQRYTVLAEGNHGVAILNDCKYGGHVLDHTITMTLLRAPVIPDMKAELGRQEFSYAIYPYEGDFSHSDVVLEAIDFNIPFLVASGGMTETSFSCEHKNIIIDAVKPAQKEQKAICIRVYEAMGMTQTTTIGLPKQIKTAYEANMLEEKKIDLTVNKESICLKFKPFEIKTIVLMI